MSREECEGGEGIIGVASVSANRTQRRRRDIFVAHAPPETEAP